MKIWLLWGTWPGSSFCPQKNFCPLIGIFSSQKKTKTYKRFFEKEYKEDFKLSTGCCELDSPLMLLTEKSR